MKAGVTSMTFGQIAAAIRGCRAAPGRSQAAGVDGMSGAPGRYRPFLKCAGAGRGNVVQVGHETLECHV
jgi:hypothetical protein